MTAWLDSPAQWSAVAAYARKAKILGIDSETWGHSVKETSPAYRACVHVWSIAFYTSATTRAGAREARGAVLPREALGAFSGVLADPSITKIAHNSRHDRHAFENHGIVCRGVIDTLDLVRFVWPERAVEGKSYALKPIAESLLAKPPRYEYADIIKTMGMIKQSVKVCACGKEKCRGRKLPTHEKIETEVEVPGKIEYRLEDIVPGHPQWFRLLDYAAADAVDALELYDLAMAKLGRLRRPEVPW